MCGIVGFNWEDKILIKNLVKTLEHRGPDVKGDYTDSRISLGHTRLSIIDLTSAGKQPMSNHDSTIWITFNGEIYNYKEIKQELEKKGYKFKSNTDTEVIIHAYEEHGTGCLSYLRGMFAFCIWDSNKKIMFLAKDPLGVKPLYYFFDGQRLIFSSEIKSFKAIKEIKLEVNKQSLIKLLAYRYTPDENTVFKNIKKVKAGELIIFEDNKLIRKKYYNQKENIIYNDLQVVLKKAKEIIYESVEKHMIADVEVGSFLSGGIDSSIISALAQKYMERQGNSLKTFSVGFDYFSELKYSRAVADHINSEHYEITVDYDKAIKIIPKLIWQNDEPLTDFAAIPYYLLSKFARKKVKVVVAGQGGDEIFGGYSHYRRMVNLLRFGKYAPKAIVHLSSKIPHRKFKRASQLLLMSHNLSKVYSDTYFVFKEDELIKTFNMNNNPLLSPIESLDYKKIKNNLNRILYTDQNILLTEYFNTVVDKMTMANALEERVPYIDKYVVDFSFNINPKLKANGKREKIILKKLGRDILPEITIKRKKQGYGAPYYEWIKSGLGDIITSSMENPEICKDKIIPKEMILKTIPKVKESESAAMRAWILYTTEEWYKKFIM